MNNTELILRILLNTKTQRKRQYRTVTYILLGMNVTVSKNMSIKIDELVAQNKVRNLRMLLDNYSENIITNFKG